MRMTRRGMIVAALTGCLLGLPIGHVTANAAPLPTQHPGYHPCPVEDAPGPCWWDAGSSGNGQGQSFYVTRDQRVVYGHLHWRVIANRHTATLPDAHPCRQDRGSYGDPTTCLTVGPWHRVSQPLADALAEGSSPHATTRDWEGRCFTHRNGPERLIACVGGYVENW